MGPTTFIVLTLLCLSFVNGNDEFSKIDSIRQESQCVRAGGICTLASDCPHGHLSEDRGLCPHQKYDGIECCHGVSIKETRCSKNGGRCILMNKQCNSRQIFSEATDCPKDKKCCIMTRD